MNIFDDYIDWSSEQRFGTLMVEDKPEVSMPEAVKPNVLEQAVSTGLQDVKQDVEQKPIQSLYGAAKGAVEGSIGLPGDLVSIVKGIYYATQTPEGKSKLDEFLKGAESATGLPTTEDVKGFLDTILPKTEAEAAEVVGQLLSPAGYVKPAVKTIKATKNMLKAKK